MSIARPGEPGNALSHINQEIFPLQSIFGIGAFVGVSDGVA